MRRALVLAVAITCLCLIGSAVWADPANHPSKIVNAKSFDLCTMLPLPCEEEGGGGGVQQPPPKHWTPGTAITGTASPSGLVLAVTLDPDNPDSALFTVSASDMDHWERLDPITGLPVESGDEPDQMKATVNWGCEGGHFQPPANGYSATWVTPEDGDFYRVWAGVDDLPLPPGPGETGSRGDDSRALQPDAPPAAVEAVLTVAMSGQFHGHFPPFDTPEIELGDPHYWNQHSDRDLGITTPDSPLTYQLRGFFKRTEVRATLIPHLPEYPAGFTWTQEVAGAMYIDGALEDKGPYDGACVKQKWTADPIEAPWVDVTPDGSDEIQLLDPPGWPVPGAPDPWSTGYEDDLDHTLHMVGLLPNYGGVCEFRDKVTFRERRISKGWGDDPLWTREVRLYSNNTTGRKWVAAANN